MTDDRMISEQELAVRWGKSERTIKRWRKEGGGKVPPSYPLGKKGGFGQGVKYRLSEVIEFEDRQKQGAQCESTADAASAAPEKP
ncbi:hypothetical protein [Pseudomonas phage Itty13]|uniref:Helix-turn-helix domain-containing protein n=1 Tax=Pseudomonas phage Itty13 TaxID=2805750 RepID=A0A889IQT8_9CAUD|nr:terminase small subunit [Pseudomonas phage Itty13]QRE00646.1 hypothetical protein [Pseudomonas phage Itty13]